MKVMRPSLLPGLIAAARRNLDRGASSVRLFEIGRRYLDDAEHPTLSLLLAGEKRPRDWQSGKAQPFDAFDAKAEVLALLDAGGRADDEPAGVSRCRADLASGAFGQAWARAEDRCSQASASFTRGCRESSMRPRARSPPRSISTPFPLLGRAGTRGRPTHRPRCSRSLRDFAFIVPADLAAETLLRAIRGADKAAITAVRLFDRFEAPDGLSLAFEVTLQPVEKSFTDEQIGDISQAHRRCGGETRRSAAGLVRAH